MAINDQQSKTFENDIKQHSYVEQKLQNQINKLSKEKEQLSEELQNLSDRYDGVNEELNAKNYQINDFKEKLVESQQRLVKTQHDLQSAQNEIINLEKELQLSKENSEELKEKIKVIFEIEFSQPESRRWREKFLIKKTNYISPPFLF